VIGAFFTIYDIWHTDSGRLQKEKQRWDVPLWCDYRLRLSVLRTYLKCTRHFGTQVKVSLEKGGTEGRNVTKDSGIPPDVNGKFIQGSSFGTQKTEWSVSEGAGGSRGRNKEEKNLGEKIWAQVSVIYYFYLSKRNVGRLITMRQDNDVPLRHPKLFWISHYLPFLTIAWLWPGCQERGKAGDSEWHFRDILPGWYPSTLSNKNVPSGSSSKNSICMCQRDLRKVLR